MEDQADRLAVQFAQCLQFDQRRVLVHSQMPGIFTAGLTFLTTQQDRFHAQALRRPGFAVGAVSLHRVNQRTLQHLSAFALTSQHAALTHQFIDRAANGVAVDAEALGQLEFGGQEIAGLIGGQLFTQNVGELAVHRTILSRQLHD